MSIWFALLGAVLVLAVPVTIMLAFWSLEKFNLDEYGWRDEN
jgi:hypothetical protein